MPLGKGGAEAAALAARSERSLPLLLKDLSLEYIGGALYLLLLCAGLSRDLPPPGWPPRPDSARRGWETTCHSVRGRDLCRAVVEDSKHASTRGRGYIFDVTCVQVQYGIFVMFELRGPSITGSSVNQKSRHTETVSTSSLL